MYWVVFAIFISCEHFCDILISWLPFYYETKVLIVIWLSSNYTKGASVIYRRVLHPLLLEKEKVIDNWIEQKQSEGVDYIVSKGKQGVAMVGSSLQSSGTSLANKAVANGLASSFIESVVNAAGSVGQGTKSKSDQKSK